MRVGGRIAARVGIAVAVSIGFAASGAAAAPTAEAAPRAEHALWLHFDGPWLAEAAALAESDLRTAFNRRGLEVGRVDDAGAAARRPLLTITVDSEMLEHIVLVLQAPPDVPVTRRLDLTAFPPDGRVLALVVAADELLAAASDQGRWRKAQAAPAAPPTKTNDILPVPTAVQAMPVAQAREHMELDAGLAFEHFSGGQTHLGPTLTGTYGLGERWFAALAADGRQGRAVTTADAQVTSRLLGARLAAGARVLGQGDPLTLSLDAGVRAGRLWFEGRPVRADSAAVGTQVGTWSVVGDLRLALEARLGRRSPVSVRVGAGVGVPLLAQIAANATAPGATAPVTAASGIVFESQAGIGLHF